MPDSVSLLDRASLPAIPKPHCASPLSVTHPKCNEPLSPPSTFIPARSFNRINLYGSLVVKSSSAASIHGELHFYRHVPQNIAHLFPRLQWHDAANGSVSLAIERILGTTLSALLVEGTLSNALLFKVMRSLTELHRSPGNGERIDDSLIYASYARKVAARFLSHKAEYLACGLSDTHFEALLPLLHAYESQHRGHAAMVIHGDPVLTNVLSAKDGSVKLIDMRGAQGRTLTLAGDAVYDLGKVVQSLCGYDHVLAGKTLDGTVVRKLVQSQKMVREYVEKVYAEVRWKDVILVVCSLFTSLIPLHDDIRNRKQFARVAGMLLTCVRKAEVMEETIVRLVAEALNGNGAMNDLTIEE